MRAPGQGTKLKDGRWKTVVTLTAPDGSKIRKQIYAPTQRELREKADALRKQTQHRTGPGVTVAELYESCLKGPWAHLAKGTLQQRTGAWKRLAPAFGRRRVGDVTVPEVFAFLEHLGALGLSKRYVAIHRDLLRLVFNRAVLTGLRADNPAAGWHMPHRPSPPARPRLTPEDAAKVAHAHPDRRKRLYLQILWETAARPGEAVKLAPKNLRRDPSTGWWIDVPGTKTPAANRTVPISEALAQELLDLPEPWFPFGSSRQGDLFRDALAAAGIWDGAVQPPEGLPPLYSLRKARIEMWGDMGVSDEVWAKLAGHSDPDLTRRVYDRVSESRIAAQLGLGVPPSVSRETPKKRI